MKQLSLTILSLAAAPSPVSSCGPQFTTKLGCTSEAPQSSCANGLLRSSGVLGPRKARHDMRSWSKYRGLRAERGVRASSAIPVGWGGAVVQIGARKCLLAVPRSVAGLLRALLVLLLLGLVLLSLSELPGAATGMSSAALGSHLVSMHVGVRQGGQLVAVSANTRCICVYGR